MGEDAGEVMGGGVERGHCSEQGFEGRSHDSFQFVFCACLELANDSFSFGVDGAFGETMAGG